MPHEQVDECDIETLIPKLAGTTWLNHYLESLPNLEAQKQMCRQVISMRCSNGLTSVIQECSIGVLGTACPKLLRLCGLVVHAGGSELRKRELLSVIHTEVRHR